MSCRIGFSGGNFALGFFVVAGLIGLWPTPASAWRGGPPPGFNGSTSSNGNSCRACHGAEIGPGSVQILGAPSQYTPNTVYNIQVRIADSGKVGAGFQFSAEDPAGNHLGTLIVSDAVNTQLNGSDPSYLNHNNAGVNNSVAGWAGNGNSATFNLQWQAPPSSSGPIRLWAAGNAINNNSNSAGDRVYLTSVLVGAPPGPGACCDIINGTCSGPVTQQACELGGGIYGGNDTTCATVDCTGACCDESTGNCTEGHTRISCESGGGRFGNAQSTCANIDPPCLEPGTGACCEDARGVCTEGVTQAECEADGFRYGGDLTSCNTINPSCEAAVSISLQPFISGLSSPIDLTHAGDGSGRIFIVDQVGQIRVVNADGTLRPIPFLDISAKIPPPNAFFDERGLLGLAFHPNYENNGRFFIRYSAPRAGAPEEPCNQPGFIVGCHSEILAEYSVSLGDPNVADPNSEIILYSADKPQFNHNSGQVAFGPDGYLYFTLGDGGGANDGLADVPPSHGPIGNGQDRFAKLGKMHRIDVDAAAEPPYPFAIPDDNPFADGVDGLPEIYAYGLRNAFKFSFDDGPTGDGTLYLPDVGQNLFEEVNIGANGANYGWVIREGAHCFDPFLPNAPPPTCDTTGALGEPLVDPVMEYLHRFPCNDDGDCAALGVGCDEAAGLCENEGGISIIGGYVYDPAILPRGGVPGLDELIGKYAFGDFSDAFSPAGGRLYYMDVAGPNAFERRQFFLSPTNAPLGLYVKGFGEDEDGNLYAMLSSELGPLGTAGSVQRIAAPFPAAPTADATGLNKTRFISFQVPPTLVGGSVETALRINLTSMHQVVPPYSGGITIPFDAFNGEHVWAGPPVEFIESISTPIPFYAAFTQCTPHYRDWSTVGLLHVTGVHIVPSSTYHVESVAAVCQGVEGSGACSSGGASVSARLEIKTTRWGDIRSPYNPPDPSIQPDISDVSALVDKFRSVPGAPIKARSILAGAPGNAFGEVNQSVVNVDIGFSQISSCVDAYRGAAYPYRMGKCAGAPTPPSTGACNNDLDCGGVNGAGPCHIYCP